MTDVISSINDVSSSLSTALTTEMQIRQLSDEHLESLTDSMSQQISALSADNAEIWKSLRGSLNFRAVLSVKEDWPDVSSFLVNDFTNIYNIAPSAAA